MTARVTMEPTRPDLAIVPPEPAGAPTSEDASEQGLRLFRSGQTREAMPFLERGAQDGDARAQYVYATALFNGDIVTCDKARAFELMQRASDAGLPQAAESLAQMRAFTAPAEAAVEPQAGRDSLMSDEAIARCRTTLAGISGGAQTPDYPADSLATMVQRLLVVELRERLEKLLPGTIERAVGAIQARLGADKS